MTKKNKIFLAAGAVLLILLILLACLLFGGKEGTQQPAETAGMQSASGEYTVQLQTDSGMPLEGVGIYVYTDETQAELVWFARTDAEGKITFRDTTCAGYIAVLDGVSADYTVEESYPLTGEHTLIVVEALMQSDVDLSAITKALGDVMFDFTITTPEGEEYTLSELLKEKDAVVLNFWYLECQPCRAEFPYLQEAYEEYSDRIEVLAMNPVNDDQEAIAAFKKELDLTFPMFAVDPDWAHAMQLTAYPTTVVIDRFGIISLIHRGSVTSTKVFADAFAHFVGDDYEQGVVENIEDLETEAPGADPSDPIELGGVQSFQVTIPAGGKVYYHLYRVNGYLSASNTNIYAIYDGTTYNAGSGIGFNVKAPDTYTPAKVTFGNNSKEEQTFTVYIAKAAGVVDNPYTAKLNQKFTTKVASGNEQGVYYQVTASKDGYLIFECLESPKGIEFDYLMQSMRTSRQNSLQADGNEEGTMFSIKVNAGDTVKCWIVTVKDKSGNPYPGGTFKSKLYMSDTPITDETEAEAKIDYAVTVTDEKRNPIPGVYLNLNTGESKAVVITTDEKGVAHTELAAGTYPVVLVLPTGYTAATTEFSLTEARPYVSLKLDTLVVEMAEYVITVVDADGHPVAGAVVMMGEGIDPVTTDENGQVKLTLPKKEYTFAISLPSGAVQNGTIAAEEAEKTIVADQNGGSGEGGDEGGGETVPKITYTVKVADYAGNAQSGVMVQIKKDGSTVAAQTTDASGQITAELAEDDYTVELSVSGKYYEKTDAVLSTSRPYLVLRVTADHRDTPDSAPWFGSVYEVGVGGTHVYMQANATTYFAFEPAQEGMYRITASNPNAVVDTYGNIMFPNRQYINDDNSFDLNVKESNIGGTYAIGVTGVSECILVIERIGSAELDETDVPWTVYEGNPPTKAYSVGSSKNLTYVDMTSETDSIVLVKDANGYYHLDSASGKMLYVNLGPNAPYISMYNMLGFTGFGGTRLGRRFYDANGELLLKEDYTECMSAYVECIDSKYGVYPLTDDLIYMLQNGGAEQGWWDTTDENNFLFSAIDGFNPELGWMFAVCY